MKESEPCATAIRPTVDIELDSINKEITSTEEIVEMLKNRLIGLLYEDVAALDCEDGPKMQTLPDSIGYAQNLSRRLYKVNSDLRSLINRLGV